jgi:tRNA(Ile)-lysidine synthase
LTVREQFLNHIERFKLCGMADSILVAVSGGVDSMVMLSLFKDAGYTVGVAHCNFQLRGKESDEDEIFVRQVCQDLQVPVHTKRFDTEAYAWESGLSIQMAARKLRYEWFNELLDIHAHTRLATGHHFDDTMETILLNLTKGTPTDGLVGIPVKNGNVIRPILFATRRQVEEYASRHSLVWREDRSNLTDDYQRNFVRHHIVPKLKELNPSLETTWQTSIEKIQGDLELLHHSFNDWKTKFVVERSDRVTILKKGFEAYLAADSVLWRFIKTYSFNFEQAREIIHTLKGQPGKRFLSPTHLLVVDRAHLIITKHQQEWNPVMIEEGQDDAVFGPWRLQFVEVPEIRLNSGRMEAFFDADKVRFPLVWRTWRNGDAFQPLGMPHTKKISDFLVDNKLSLIDKKNVTVLESASEIVYVVGWRIDDRFKITDQTKRILNLRLQKL